MSIWDFLIAAGVVALAGVLVYDVWHYREPDREEGEPAPDPLTVQMKDYYARHSEER